ncbi:O-antigen ligase family protein [Microcoleus sp. F6_B4]
MKTLYTILFTLSIILINPAGSSRGLIWTSPKVLIIWLIVGVNIALLWEQRKALTIPRQWKISLILWTIFLSIGAISTLQSPFPLTSFLGQDQMGDGWLYWLLIAAFTLSNSLLLTLHPQLINSQFHGLLIGGIILSLSIFPQIIDWRIDYTATMGQIIRADVNASSIFQGQQPIGLYSHRGHAAIVLALIIIAAIVGWFSRFTATKLTAITLILTVPALLLTSTRSAILALMVASAYLLRRKYYKIVAGIALSAIIAIGIMTVSRPLDWSKPSIAQIMSSRSPMWTLSARGIKKRPLFGWGFDGFGIAYPYIRNPQVTPIVVNLDQFTYDYINIKGEISTREIPTYKAHNWILDTTLSVGIFGLVAGIALWGYYICLALNSSLRGIEAVAIAYLIFTFTWFDCAQYAHIAWWTMSLAAVKSASATRFSRFRAESGQLLITH